jgi:hypothetical protein
MRGMETISSIIADITSVIWKTLQPLFMHHQMNENGNVLQKDILIFGTCQTA